MGSLVDDSLHCWRMIPRDGKVDKDLICNDRWTARPQRSLMLSSNIRSSLISHRSSLQESVPLTANCYLV
jgi:hypothetical protein